jgi:hypothetical protein
MSVTVEASKTTFANPGDECDSCREFWTNRQPPQSPRVLVDLGVKTDYGISVIVCPWCDGEPILKNNGKL